MLDLKRLVNAVLSPKAADLVLEKKERSQLLAENSDF